MIFQQICVLSSALNPAPSSSLSLLYPLKVWTGCCGPLWTWSWTCRCPGRGRLGWRRSCGCCGSWRRSWRRRGSRARKSCPPGSKKTNASGCSSGRPRNRWTYRRVSRPPVEPLSTCYMVKSVSVSSFALNVQMKQIILQRALSFFFLLSQYSCPAGIKTLCFCSLQTREEQQQEKRVEKMMKAAAKDVHKIRGQSRKEVPEVQTFRYEKHRHHHRFIRGAVWRWRPHRARWWCHCLLCVVSERRWRSSHEQRPASPTCRPTTCREAFQSIFLPESFPAVPSPTKQTSGGIMKN